MPETSAKTSPMLQTLFWGWDAPVVENAVEHLMAGWDEKAALDLSETFILVPNAEAARRLRETRADDAADEAHAEAQRGAVSERGA